MQSQLILLALQGTPGPNGQLEDPGIALLSAEPARCLECPGPSGGRSECAHLPRCFGAVAEESARLVVFILSVHGTHTPRRGPRRFRGQDLRQRRHSDVEDSHLAWADSGAVRFLRLPRNPTCREGRSSVQLAYPHTDCCVQHTALRSLRCVEIRRSWCGCH